MVIQKSTFISVLCTDISILCLTLHFFFQWWVHHLFATFARALRSRQRKGKKFHGSRNDRYAWDRWSFQDGAYFAVLSSKSNFFVLYSFIFVFSRWVFRSSSESYASATVSSSSTMSDYSRSSSSNDSDDFNRTIIGNPKEVRVSFLFSNLTISCRAHLVFWNELCFIYLQIVKGLPRHRSIAHCNWSKPFAELLSTWRITERLRWSAHAVSFYAIANRLKSVYRIWIFFLQS